MKRSIRLLLPAVLLLAVTAVAGAQPIIISKTTQANIKGAIVLLPGESPYVEKTTMFLNSQGFDVINIGSITLRLAIEEFRLLKSTRSPYIFQGLRKLDIVGIENGGSIAAGMVQRLNDDEQPDNLLLISPTGIEATLPGTVMPAVMPPLAPKRLFINNKSEYTKIWIGYDGIAVVDSNESALMKAFINATPVVNNASAANPAALAVKGYSLQRHAEKLAKVAAKKYDLIMLGNSITNNFEKPEYQPVWNQFFAPRNALNLGFSGYRTENIIWNIQNGELEGQHPKVLVLEIGTNNIDEKNYPTRHTAGQLAGGIKAVVNIVRAKLPDTKIILLRCFPGCYGGPNPTSHRAILERASDIVSTMADGEHIFYCDVNHVFLNVDGSINHDMMPDWLHPSPAGAKAWAQAMEPLLAQLMGDKSLDTSLPANTAIIPVPKLEEDSYNWWDRHAEVLRIKDSINPEIVLIGNSITHFWGGLPQLKYADGKLRAPNGPKAWDSAFGKYRTLNLGFGWDRTQNVLWRLDHGELDGLHPRTVIIDIGTNNTSQTTNARMNTAEEIVDGIRAVVVRVWSKVPHAKIVVMAIFPREKDPQNPRRILINEINRQLKTFTTEQQITLVDIGPNMLAADGTFLPGMMLDFTHPTDKGYQVWADGIKPFIDGGN